MDNQEEEVVKLKCQLKEHEKRLNKFDGKIDNMAKELQEQKLMIINTNSKVNSIDEKVDKLVAAYEENLRIDANDKKEFLKKAFYYILSTFIGAAGGILSMKQ